MVFSWKTPDNRPLSKEVNIAYIQHCVALTRNSVTEAEVITNKLHQWNNLSQRAKNENSD
jgi:hypothetical protein